MQLRYIVNPPGAKVSVNQHLDIGQGEIDWDVFFGTLQEIRFDGILSSCVFAWQARAEDCSRFMRREIRRYLDKYPVALITGSHYVLAPESSLPPAHAAGRTSRSFLVPRSRQKKGGRHIDGRVTTTRSA